MIPASRAFGRSLWWRTRAPVPWSQRPRGFFQGGKKAAKRRAVKTSAYPARGKHGSVNQFSDKIDKNMTEQVRRSDKNRWYVHPMTGKHLCRGCEKIFKRKNCAQLAAAKPLRVNWESTDGPGHPSRSQCGAQQAARFSGSGPQPFCY
jgi:hypothetical protein